MGLPALRIVLALGFMPLGFVMVPCVGAQSLLDARLSADRIEAGDTFQLVVRIVALDKVVMPALDMSSWAGLDTALYRLRQGTWRRKGDSLEQRHTYLALAPGTFPLPPIVLQGVGYAAAQSQAMTLQVAAPSAPDDASQMADLRDIMVAPPKRSGLWAGMAGLAILTLLAWWWMRARKRGALRVEARRANPYMLAKALLQRLVAQKNPANGRFRVHYEALSSILRTYLQDRCGIPALVLTTSELRDRLSALPFGAEAFALLERSDLVKFAKIQPDTAQAEADLRDSLHWIDAWEAHKVAETSSQPQPNHP